MSNRGWIGVDLDGTLAYYEIGQPIEPMVERVKRWLDQGHRVTEQHIGQRLEVTCVKDYGMIELWDDRAVQVEPNTGQLIGRSSRHPV